jgi:hypothetical protein
MEDLGNSMILNLLFKPAAILMGSRIRSWLMNRMKTIQGVGMGSVLYRSILWEKDVTLLGKPKLITLVDALYNRDTWQSSVH